MAFLITVTITQPLDIGMFKTPIRRVPGVATSAVSRRHLEGDDGRFGRCTTFLWRVAQGGSIQFGVFVRRCVLSFCQVTEKEYAGYRKKAAWKRQISVLRKLGKINDAVAELSKFADTFYTDVEAWLELADIYASNHQYALPIRPNSRIIDSRARYASALQSLSHVLLLTPQNPFYVLQAAETAYTAQDIPLAMKFFLMAIEMTGDDNEDATPQPPTGVTLRAWYGVELVSHLQHHASTNVLD
jgi:tetratricopeptide (TPR) repeat protein